MSRMSAGSNGTLHSEDDIQLSSLEGFREQQRPLNTNRNLSQLPASSPEAFNELESPPTPTRNSEQEQLLPSEFLQVIWLPDETQSNNEVNRNLNGIQLFMITINATIGIGLYWRGGQILELGGPLALLLSFLIVGILCWSVMQCISEMASMWPVPGAMSLYVEKFVDKELGTIVGFAYWFTYSSAFSTLIAASAAEFDFWGPIKDNDVFHGVVLYCLIPIGLLLINLFRVEIYGWFEVVAGTLKILFIFVIISVMIAITFGAGSNNHSIGTQYWNETNYFDQKAADNWGSALLISMSVATFAFIGTEVAAASALEAALPPPRKQEARGPQIQNGPGITIKFSCRSVPVIATLAYAVSGVLGTFDIAPYNCQLPRVSWLQASNTTACEGVSSSSFVLIAYQSGIPHMADVINAFLIFTCLTCASTNLFVASRTLFGLTTSLDGGHTAKLHIRFLAYFGRTDARRVPRRAMIASAISFSWVPFLQFVSGTHSSSKIFIDVLGSMASCGVLIVWACECLAFIRYYLCICQHRHKIKDKRLSPYTHRWLDHRGHGQPIVAYIALLGCLFLLFVANGAALWNRFHLLPFLSSYFTVLVFFLSWGFLKVIKGAPWSIVDLSKSGGVEDILADLHNIALASAQVQLEDLSS